MKLELKEFEKIINAELIDDDKLRAQRNRTLIVNVERIIKKQIQRLYPYTGLYVSTYNSNIQIKKLNSDEVLILKVKKKLSKDSSKWEREYDFKQVCFEPFYNDNGEEIKTFEGFIEYCNKKAELLKLQSDDEIRKFIECLSNNGLDIPDFIEILDIWGSLKYQQKNSIRNREYNMCSQVVPCRSEKDKNVICCFTDKDGHRVEIFTIGGEGFDSFARIIDKNLIIKHWDRNDILHQRNGIEDIFSFIDERAASIEYIRDSISFLEILKEAECDRRYINMRNKIAELENKS